MNELDLTIERLGIHGEGVARHEGFTIFVDGALQNERVNAEVYERHKSFARAKVVKRHRTSTDRVDPICPYFGRCGGCQLMHLSYEKQLEAKRNRVADALERIAKIKVEVKPCIPSPRKLGYRNKIQLPVSQDQTLGLYAYNSHQLIEIEKCPIHCELGEKAFNQIQKILKLYPADLRHVLIKTSVNTSQVLVILVTKSETDLTQLARKISQSIPEVKGVVQNINGSLGNVILGKTFKVLVGQGWIEEVLNGLTFKVSPASFFQVNPGQAEALYQMVVEWAGLTGKETVLDAYCGVGTLALILAQHAKEVIGIEVVAEAIADARENAKRNQIGNTKFICGLAEKEIGSVSAFEMAVINPPRKGCEPVFLNALTERSPKRILYISCDPATLSRDAAILNQKGYSLEQVQPFDMFPQTMHVECLSLFSRARAEEKLIP